MKSCSDCKYAVLVDDGYSNYTVENTTFYCAKKVHPNGSFDNFYGEDKRLEFAEQCTVFVAGEPVQIDVDQECWETFNEEQLKIAKDAGHEKPEY